MQTELGRQQGLSVVPGEVMQNQRYHHEATSRQQGPAGPVGMSRSCHPHWMEKEHFSILGQPKRGGDALLLSLRRWQGDASLIQSHVQVPEALHGGGR